jgi:hypothetical protein
MLADEQRGSDQVFDIDLETVNDLCFFLASISLKSTYTGHVETELVPVSMFSL